MTAFGMASYGPTFRNGGPSEWRADTGDTMGGYTLYSCIGPKDQSRFERLDRTSRYFVLNVSSRLGLAAMTSQSRLHTVTPMSRSRHSKVSVSSRDYDVSVSASYVSFTTVCSSRCTQYSIVRKPFLQL